MRVFLSLCAAFFGLAACAPVSGPPLDLQPLSFGQMDGWAAASHAKALGVFAASCPAIAKGANLGPLLAAQTAYEGRSWKAVCERVQKLGDVTEAQARAFFETNFRPYIVRGAQGGTGLFTGYYEASIRGALQKGGEFQTPIYGVPNDLVRVDLGAFSADLAGRKIVGKLDGGRLVPYEDRAGIEAKGLAARAPVLLWADDPVAAFFMEVQGSGRVTLKNAEGAEEPVTWRLGYAAQNGHAYVPVGRYMADRSYIDKPVSMQKIRAYLKAHPAQVQEILWQNPSYVFFRVLPQDGGQRVQGFAGPPGALNIPLTPLYSLAVDPHYIPLGAPVWLYAPKAQNALLSSGEDIAQHAARLPLEEAALTENAQPLTPRLLIAQDTGGAIKGAVRGDVFWGHGAEAESAAGRMQAHLNMVLLLPE